LENGQDPAQASTLPAIVDVQIDPLEFARNLLVAGLLAFVLGWIYVRWGRSLSNRKAFARNFALLSMTTMLIISIVKANLALSLGLVGALSIVRFRSAIKEPEELAYLFLAIAIGLGLGADQLGPTLLAFVLIAAVVGVKHALTRGEDEQNLLLTVSSAGPGRIELEEIVRSLESTCSGLSLKRFEEREDEVEASFQIELASLEELTRSKAELRRRHPAVELSFFDNRGLFG